MNAQAANAKPARPERLLPLSAVCAQVGQDRSTVYRRVAERTFPLPIKVGSRSLWVESEVQAWIAARIAVARMGQSMGQRDAA